MTSGRTLVLLPYGMPEHAAQREACFEILIACGGAIDRMIDQPANDLDRFGKYAARIPALREGAVREPPIVMLTRTSPLPLTVLAARRALERAVPTLCRASWILFVTETDDPFFREGADRLGVLSGDLEQAPVWLGPDSMPFMVTTPTTLAHGLLSERYFQLRSHGEKFRRPAVMTSRPPTKS